MAGMKKERPFELNAVIIIAVFFGVASIIISRYSIINQELIFSNVSSDLLPYLILYLYASIVIGFIQLIVAYGLYKAMKWAWYLAVIGCFVYLFSSLIYSVLIFPDVFSILINLGCLFLLYWPSVRAYFEK